MKAAFKKLYHADAQALPFSETISGIHTHIALHCRFVVASEQIGVES
jgi:hypothetical protein